MIGNDYASRIGKEVKLQGIDCNLSFLMDSSLFICGKFKINKSKKMWILVLIVVLIMGALAGCSKTTTVDEEVTSLLVYSGVGLRKPMDEIGKLFGEKYGVEIQYSYAGSAQNLNQIELSGEGDVYVPGALYYYNAAKEKDLVVSEKNVAYHIPVIAVPKNNPVNIKTLKDLTNSGVKVILADPKSAAIGKGSKKILEKNELFDGVEENTIALTATVNELVVYLTMEQCDASIVWEDNVKDVEEIQIIKIPEKKI